MSEPIEQKKVGDNSPQANAQIYDSTGRVLAIIAFGASFLALGASLPGYFQMRDIRTELLQEIQRSESRVIADNREKSTAFTLLDSHYRELKAKVEAEQKNERRR